MRTFLDAPKILPSSSDEYMLPLYLHSTQLFEDIVDDKLCISCVPSCHGKPTSIVSSRSTLQLKSGELCGTPGEGTGTLYKVTKVEKIETAKNLLVLGSSMC